MEAYREAARVAYGESGIRYLVIDGKRRELCFPMHWHERMEILYVESGELLLYLGEDIYTVGKGRAAVLSPRMMHGGFAGEQDVHFHVLMFEVERFCNDTIASERYLRPVCSREIQFVPVISAKEVTEAIWGLVEVMKRETSGQPLCAEAGIYRMFGALYQNQMDERKTIHKADEQLREILDFIGNHYTEQISADDISRKFGYNEAYFCRKFKAVTGLTVMKYIQILRLELAQKLLRDEKEEIGTIAWKCGFSDVSYFSNCFKKELGVTPSMFRKIFLKSLRKN